MPSPEKSGGCHSVSMTAAQAAVLIVSSPGLMDGMNPERVRMLRMGSPAPDPDDDAVAELGSSPPRITGANCLPVGGSVIKEEDSLVTLPRATGPRPAPPRVARDEAVAVARPASVAGTKRPRSRLDDGEARPQLKQHNPEEERLQYSLPPALLPAPPPNPHTIYLESLLQSHPFQLTIQSKLTKACDGTAITYHRTITNAGLVLNEAIHVQVNIPMLQLPTLSRLSGDVDRSVYGQLLEDVWFELTPESKFCFARQLRKILTTMREPPRNGKKRQLGSLRSGPYSLVLDKHSRNTYWAIRSRPTDGQFVAFLLSSFSSSVPNTVAKTLARQFRPSYSLVLSHGEISPKHIIVDNSKIVHIIGWDCGGWYPEWWDYAKFFEACTRSENQDWYDYASEIFPEAYPEELAAYQGIVRCQKS